MNKVKIGTFRFRDKNGTQIGDSFKASYLDSQFEDMPKLIEKMTRLELKNGNITKDQVKIITNISIVNEQ